MIKEIKKATLEVVKEDGEEMIVFIAEEPNLSYTIKDKEDKYIIDFTFTTRDINPVVAFILKRNGSNAHVIKVYIDDTDTAVLETKSYGLSHYIFFREEKERMIYNGTYFTARIESF